MKLKISRSKIEIRRNFFTNKIKKRWNDLSQEIINSKATDAFKRAYDQEKGLIRRRQHREILAQSIDLNTYAFRSMLTAVNQP